jgi:hypothetical protein
MISTTTPTRQRRHDGHRTAESPASQIDLPVQWRGMAIVPSELRAYRDYEMAAERVAGWDENGQFCYCCSRFIIAETRSDDDEEFYQVAAYAESRSAWRLRDGLWLIYRVTTRDGERGHGFYSLVDHMPH